MLAHSIQSVLSFRLLSRKAKIETHKTIILSVVLYGCEIWSLTLRGEHRLKLSENGKEYLHPRQMKEEEDGQNCIGLIKGSYSMSNTIRMSRACSTHGTENAYWILVEKPEGKRPLGYPRRRWGII
jgi:hypothetical protein